LKGGLTGIFNGVTDAISDVTDQFLDSLGESMATQFSQMLETLPDDIEQLMRDLPDRITNSSSGIVVQVVRLGKVTACLAKLLPCYPPTWYLAGSILIHSAWIKPVLSRVGESLFSPSLQHRFVFVQSNMVDA